MEVRIYAIFDREAGSFMMDLIPVLEEAHATRGIMRQLSNDKSTLCQHAADFDLIQVGAFDTTKGALTDFPVNITVANLQTLKHRMEKNAQKVFGKQTEVDQEVQQKRRTEAKKE